MKSSKLLLHWIVCFASFNSIHTIKYSNRLFVLRGGGGIDSSSKKVTNTLATKQSFFLTSFLRKLTGRAAQDSYTEALKDQIEILKNQLRKAQEETRQLRALLKLNSKITRKESFDTIRQQSSISEQELRDEIARLLKYIDSLSSLKKELEDLLEVERKRIIEQEKIISIERERNSNLQQEAEKEAQKRTKEMLTKVKLEQDKSKKEMDELRTKLLKEFRKQMEETSTSFHKKMEEEGDKIKQEYEEKLKDEKRRSLEAVENEKDKMRKLVKALSKQEEKNNKNKSTKTTTTTTATGNIRNSAKSNVGNTKKLGAKFVKKTSGNTM